MERFRLASAVAVALLAGSGRPAPAQCFGPPLPAPVGSFRPAPIYYQPTWTWLTPATPTRISTETRRPSTPPGETAEPDDTIKPQPMPKKADRPKPPPPPIKDPDSTELPTPPPMKKQAADPEPGKKAGTGSGAAVPFDVYPVASDGSLAADEPAVGIGFYNNSDRDVTLEVADRVVTLKRDGRPFKIRLPREFVWRQMGGPEVKGHVPGGAAGLEIVFRK